MAGSWRRSAEEAGMERSTIEHLVGVITPAFQPESSFSFRFTEGRLIVEVRPLEWRSLLRPDEPQGVTIAFTPEFLTAYEGADELARGAADANLVAVTSQHVALGQSSWSVSPEDVRLRPQSPAAIKSINELGTPGLETSRPRREAETSDQTPDYPMIRYWPILDAIETLDFIPDEKTAEAAVKAVVGTLASRLPEERARKFAGALPEPLTYEKLRGRQTTVTDISSEQYVRGISEQFGVERDQAQSLICTVLSAALEEVDEVVFSDLEEGLPADWKELVRQC